jgi:hypothetical protein
LNTFLKPSVVSTRIPFFLSVPPLSPPVGGRHPRNDVISTTSYLHTLISTRNPNADDIPSKEHEKCCVISLRWTPTLIGFRRKMSSNHSSTHRLRLTFETSFTIYSAHCCRRRPGLHGWTTPGNRQYSRIRRLCRSDLTNKKCLSCSNCSNFYRF